MRPSVISRWWVCFESMTLLSSCFVVGILILSLGKECKLFRISGVYLPNPFRNLLQNWQIFCWLALARKSILYAGCDGVLPIILECGSGGRKNRKDVKVILSYTASLGLHIRVIFLKRKEKEQQSESFPESPTFKGRGKLGGFFLWKLDDN